jgi:hypothetical protein
MHHFGIKLLAPILGSLAVVSASPLSFPFYPNTSTSAPLTAGVVVSTGDPFELPSNDTLVARSDLTKRRNGRILVIWDFHDVTTADVTFNPGQQNGGSTSVHPEDRIIMQYFDGDGDSPSKFQTLFHQNSDPEVDFRLKLARSSSPALYGIKSTAKCFTAVSAIFGLYMTDQMADGQFLLIQVGTESTADGLIVRHILIGTGFTTLQTTTTIAHGSHMRSDRIQ